MEKNEKKERILELLWANQQTYQQIADAVGCSRQYVWQLGRTYDIPHTEPAITKREARRIYTPEIIEKMQAMKEDGNTTEEIAAWFEVSPVQVDIHLARLKSLRQQEARMERQKRVIELHRQGYNQASIATLLACSQQTISGIIRKLKQEGTL